MTFILVYDRDAREIVSLEHFSDDEVSAAADARIKSEHKFRSKGHVEVVTLLSNDEATLRRTHARYFLSGEQLLSLLASRIG